MQNLHLKPSEALRIGAKKYGPWSDYFFPPCEGDKIKWTDALGAIWVGGVWQGEDLTVPTTEQFEKDLASLFPDVTGVLRQEIEYRSSEDDGQTREQIADWLEKQGL